MKGATSVLSSCKVSSNISLSQQVQYFHGFAETFDSLFLPCLQNFDNDLRNYPYKIYGDRLHEPSCPLQTALLER